MLVKLLSIWLVGGTSWEQIDQVIIYLIGGFLLQIIKYMVGMGASLEKYCSSYYIFDRYRRFLGEKICQVITYLVGRGAFWEKYVHSLSVRGVTNARAILCGG